MSPREELGVPAGAAKVAVDGVQLAYVREGRGPTVVCLHAIGHGARDFEALGHALSERYEVLRVDWPGHGRSSADAQPVSAQRYAALLVGLLDQLGVRAPIVIGNSIGGTAAIAYARQREVRALVLCNPGGLFAVTAPVRLFCRLFAVLFATGTKPWRGFSRAYAWYYRRLVLPMAAATAQRERIIAAGHEHAGLLRDAWRSFGRADADLRAVALSLEVPVWVAWAARDRVLPYARARACVERMRDARVTMFEAGHSAFLEQPSAFADEFVHFAESLPARSPAQRPAHPESCEVAPASWRLPPV